MKELYDKKLKKDIPYKHGMFNLTDEEIKYIKSRAKKDTELEQVLIEAKYLDYATAIFMSDFGLLDIDAIDFEDEDKITIHTLIINEYELTFGSIYGIPENEKILCLYYKDNDEFNDILIELGINKKQKSNLSKEDFEFITT